jgi:hypothetical protein
MAELVEGCAKWREEPPVSSLPTTPQGRPCGRPPAAVVLGRQGHAELDSVPEVDDGDPWLIRCGSEVEPHVPHYSRGSIGGAIGQDTP